MFEVVLRYDDTGFEYVATRTRKIRTARREFERLAIDTRLNFWGRLKQGCRVVEGPNGQPDSVTIGVLYPGGRDRTKTLFIRSVGEV